MRGIKIGKNLESLLKGIGVLLVLSGIKEAKSQCVGEVCQYNNRFYYYEQQQYQLIANATANNISRLFVNGQIVQLDDEWVQGGIAGDCQQLGIGNAGGVPGFRISNFVNNTLNFYGITGNGSIVDIDSTAESSLTNEYPNNTITVITNVNGPEQQNTSVTTIPVETPFGSGNGFGSGNQVPGASFTPVDEGTVLVPGLVPGTVPGLVEGQVPTPSAAAEEVLVPGTVPGNVQIPGTASAAGSGGLPPTTVPGPVPGLVASPAQVPPGSPGQVAGTVPGVVPGQVPGLVPGLVASPSGGNFGSVIAQSPGQRGIPIDQLGNLSFGINQQGVIQVSSNNTQTSEILQEINNNTNVTTNTVYPANISQGSSFQNFGNINNGVNNGIMNTGSIVQQNTTIGQNQDPLGPRSQIQNSTVQVNQNGTSSIVNTNNATMTQNGTMVQNGTMTQNGTLVAPNGTVLGVSRAGSPPAVFGFPGVPPSVFGVPPGVFGVGIPPGVFGVGRPGSPPVYTTEIGRGLDSGVRVFPSSSLPTIQRKLLRMPKFFKSIGREYEKQYEKYNCENDEKCQDCIDGHCYKCEDEYYILNNESPCVQCNTIEGCERCEDYLGCIRCKEEYTLLQGTRGYNRNICI